MNTRIITIYDINSVKTDVSNREFFIVRDYHRFIGHIDAGDGYIYATRRVIDNKSCQGGKTVRVMCQL